MSKDKYLLVGFGKRTTSDEKKNVILQTKGHLFQSKKCFIFLFCFFVWKTLTLLSCYWLNVFSLVNRLPGVSCWHLATTQWQQPPEKVSSCRRELFTHKKQAHKTTMSAFFHVGFSPTQTNDTEHRTIFSLKGAAEPGSGSTFPVFRWKQSILQRHMFSTWKKCFSHTGLSGGWSLKVDHSKA